MADTDIASGLEDIFNNPEIGFIANSPLLSEVVKNNPIERMQGYTGEFDVVRQGPGSPVAITGGTETYNYASNPVLTTGTYKPGRHIYPWGIPYVDEVLTGGEGDKYKIMKKKALAAMAAVEDGHAFALCSGGDSTGVTLYTGVPTMNADATYTPRGTSYTGWLSAVAPASQTATRMGISSTTYNSVWYNQYKSVSAFSTDGIKLFQLAVNLADNFGGSDSGLVDLAFADAVTFSNFLEEARTDHRIVAPGPDALSKGTGSIVNPRKWVAFGGIKFYQEPHIVLSRFSTGNTNNGVIQFFTSKQIIVKTPNQVGKLFEVKDVGKLQGQDAHGFEILSDYTIFTPMLPKHGVIANTNA